MASEGKEAPTSVKSAPQNPSKRRLFISLNPWARDRQNTQTSSTPEVRVVGPGGGVHIKKPEGDYYVSYSGHRTPRNPEDFPDDLEALVVEGTAGTVWLNTTDALSASGMTLVQRQARLKAGLPIESISDKDSKDVVTVGRYKGRVEYAPLFPKLESRKTPLFVADMEFTPTWRLTDEAFSALDTGIGHVLEYVDRQLPGIRSATEIESYLKKNFENIRDSTVREIGKTKIFDAVVYPGIVALLELGVGAGILANIIHEKKKMNRRGFLGKMFTGVKAAGAAWLTLPAAQLSLFVGTGYQGEHIPPEQRKLVQNTHPETWLFILALRNVVLAQKEQWMMENLGIKKLGTTIGSAHTVLEDEINKTSEERMTLLEAFKPLLLTMFDKESIYRIAKYGFNGKDWGLTDGYEVPELKALAGGEGSTSLAEPKIPKSVEPGQNSLLESPVLKEFKDVKPETLDFLKPFISQNIGESWKRGTVHFTDVVGQQNQKLAIIYVVTYDNLHIGYKNTVGQSAYVLSQDLKENLDVAPDHINPTVETLFLKDVKCRPGLSSGKEDDPYQYNSVVHKISFYVTDEIQDKIIKEGCTILISERGRDDQTIVDKHVYKAVPDYFKKQADWLDNKSR